MPRSRTNARIHCAVLALLLASVSCWAQDTPTSSEHDQETIAHLVEQIKELQQQDHDLLERIKNLEAKPQNPPMAESASAPMPSSSPQPTEQSSAPAATIHCNTGLARGTRNPVARVRRDGLQSSQPASAGTGNLWFRSRVGGKFLHRRLWFVSHFKTH